MMSTATLITRRVYGYEVIAGVRGALCEDGVRRTALCPRAADTVFTIPARVQVRGKTVTGFITSAEGAGGAADFHFTAISGLRNARAIEDHVVGVGAAASARMLAAG